MLCCRNKKQSFKRGQFITHAEWKLKMFWLNKNKLTFIEFFTDIWLIALVSSFNSTIPVSRTRYTGRVALSEILLILFAPPPRCCWCCCLITTHPLPLRLILLLTGRRHPSMVDCSMKVLWGSAQKVLIKRLILIDYCNRRRPFALSCRSTTSTTCTGSTRHSSSL